MIKIIGWFIIIQFVFFSAALKAQKIGYVNDTAHIIYDKENINSVVDSIVAIRHEFGWSSSWIVYFDKEQKHVAYKSYYDGDSAIRLNFWRDGILKEKDIELKAGKFYNWIYTEKYCENGQLIVKGFLNTEREHWVNYYCNGNKRVDFYELNGKPDGVDTIWYENGNIKSIRYNKAIYKDGYTKTYPTGEWKYYNENGKLDSTQVYQDKKLFKTVK